MRFFIISSYLKIEILAIRSHLDTLGCEGRDNLYLYMYVRVLGKKRTGKRPPETSAQEKSAQEKSARRKKAPVEKNALGKNAVGKKRRYNFINRS